MRNMLRFVAGGLIVAVASAGCGKSSPTAPEPPAVPEQQYLHQSRVIVDRIHVSDDGDLIGEGEFDFKWNVAGFDKQKSADLTTGDDLTIDDRFLITGDGRSFTVYFEASEWDTDILGNNFRDPDMNKRSKTVEFTGTRSSSESYSITLGNEDCKVTLHYTVQALLVPVTP
ncbi:MAG: hypothetical protein AAB011_08500 [Candidatus Eisenbacteria bacterium]